MASLSAHAKSSVIWNTGFSLFRDAVQFVQMLVLTRFLVDADYGKFALVMSIVGFMSIFSFKPFVSHALQVASDQDANFQQHFTAGIFFQCGIFLATNVVALVLASSARYAAVAPLLHVLSFTFFLEWPTEICLKILERAFDWQKRRILHGIGLLATLATSIVMAVAGCGVYSLVIPGMLVTLPFIWDLFIRQSWRPTWEFSWQKYRPAFHFGAALIGSGISSQGRTLLESSVLTAAIGFGPLGIVNRAIGLANLACNKIASQLMYAIYPVLTRLEKETGQAERAGNLIVRLVAWSAIPLAVSLACLAHPVVETVYGPKWVEVIPLMKYSLLWAVASALVHVGYMLILARNHSRLCLACDVIAFIGTGASLLFALPAGVQWYLLSLTAFHVLNLSLLTLALLRERAMTTGGLINAMLPAIASSAIAAAATYLITDFSVGAPLTFATAFVWGILFALIYVATLRIAFTRVLTELLAFFPARRYLFRFFALPAI